MAKLTTGDMPELTKGGLKMANKKKKFNVYEVIDKVVNNPLQKAFTAVGVGMAKPKNILRYPYGKPSLDPEMRKMEEDYDTLRNTIQTGKKKKKK